MCETSDWYDGNSQPEPNSADWPGYNEPSSEFDEYQYEPSLTDGGEYEFDVFASGQMDEPEFIN